MYDRRQTEAIQIQTRMATVRTGARRQLDQVVQHAQQLTDWRVQVRRHPLWAAGAVATLGYLVSSLLSARASRPSASSSVPHSPHDTPGGMAGRPSPEVMPMREGVSQERVAYQGVAPESRVHEAQTHESTLAGTVVKMMAGIVAQHLARVAITALTAWFAEATRPASASEPDPASPPETSETASDKGP